VTALNTTWVEFIKTVVDPEDTNLANDVLNAVNWDDWVYATGYPPEYA
jgi:hypothetical protein